MTSPFKTKDLITEPSQEEKIRREVSSLIDCGPRLGVPQVLGEIDRGFHKLGETPVRLIVRTLCVQNSAWRAEFQRRIRKQAKASPTARTFLSSCLDDLGSAPGRDARLTESDFIRRSRKANTSVRISIDQGSELAIGEGHRSLIAKLNEIVKETPVDLEVVFNCEHVEIHGLAIIASWCAKFAAKVTLRATQIRVREYLEQIGYRRVLEDCVTLNSPSYDSIHHVALTLVDRHHPEIADTIPERLVELFDSKIGLRENQKIPLSIMFAELIENVYRHAQSNSPAYVMAQAYPKSHTLHVVVADTGIGIFASFRESSSAKVRETVTSEVRALEMAMEKYVTSKTTRHQGYGLYIVRRLAELNGGQLRLMSGQTTRLIRSQRRPLGGSRIDSRMTDNRQWGGTAVSLMFNLNSELPIDKIWHELGPESGFEEDFFDDGP